jgi:hypothetical protein
MQSRGPSFAKVLAETVCFNYPGVRRMQFRCMDVTGETDKQKTLHVASRCAACQSQSSTPYLQLMYCHS